MFANHRWLKIGSLLLVAAAGCALAFAWAASYRAPIYVRYGSGVGEVWCVLDRGLVQVEMNLGRHGAGGWVINDFTGMQRWGWRELQILRPGWRARFGLSTWSYYLGADCGVVGKPVHGRVIFFPLAPAAVGGLLAIVAAKSARRRTVKTSNPPNTSAATA